MSARGPDSFGLLKADPPKGRPRACAREPREFSANPDLCRGHGCPVARSIIARSPAEAYVMAATIIASWMCAMMAA